MMNAGSSPDTGTEGFVIQVVDPLIAEIDTEATAAYIRFRATRVVRTRPYESDRGFVMIDFDAADEVVGVEVVGQREFSIRALLKQVPVEASDAVLNETRYVAAGLQPA